jgi:hypothetical protein
MFLFLVWQRTSPNNLSFAKSEVLVQETLEKQGKNQLVIEGLGINLRVFPGGRKDGNWITTSKGISKVNNIYYGHNWENLLGKLLQAKVGQEIKITNQNTDELVYKIKYITEVYPTQREIIENLPKDTIIVYTCSGLLDSKRFVVTAEKIS